MSQMSAPVDADNRGLVRFSRREALRLLAAQMAISLGACSKPVEDIVPYVEMPEQLVPGVPLKYATALPLGGYARGVIVNSIDGRPIKIEGNPRHPASLGSTDVFAEAEILSLYDPDRSKTVMRRGKIASWEAFQQAVLPIRQRAQDQRGAGVWLVTGRITSPTLARQVDAFLNAYPQAKWCAYEPTDVEAERKGARLAFGHEVSVRPQLDRAAIILSLGADPLGPGPDQIRNGRDYAAHRTPNGPFMSRMYVMECAPSLTGAKADYRIALHPDLIAESAIAVANALGAGLRDSKLPEGASRFVQAAITDLKRERDRAIVLSGRTLSAEIHALAHWINHELNAPMDFLEPVDRVADRTTASLADLARDLPAGKVDALFLIGVNPAFDASADLGLIERIPRARFSVHAGTHADETAPISTWHLPLSHALESWSDIRATDGTASVIQPLIQPLYATRSMQEIMALIATGTYAQSYDLVRQTWRAAAAADFDAWWTRALHDGVIPDSRAQKLTNLEPHLPAIGPAQSVSSAANLTIVLQPDPCIFDGSFGNNAWLQELPKPLTKQVWGNALALGPEEARKRGLSEGDVVEIAANGGTIEAPVAVATGHAEGVASLTLGYGRKSAGLIGTGIGANAFALQRSDSPWLIQDARVTRSGRSEDLLRPQNVVGRPEEVDKLFPVLAAQNMAAGANMHLQTGTDLPSLLPAPPRPDDGHAWGMVIDTAACIGCNACVIACQAENNVPVVGPEEIRQGRQMHWLRIDLYDHGTVEHPDVGFQPVPCMHCEQAPCEPVCPVAASVHDGEGLNVQVYNRCIGTRFCEANCPYKVRRFNFFGYADGQEYANLGLESYKAQKNPEVTVRARGVMEKCTYCVQRISGARRAAERENRPIGRDEVTTACQDACPTRAITFGDLHQADAAINRLKRDPRHYALLAHLGTRPRTTYLAEIRNRDLAPGEKRS
jgi:Fe-S-cluster-containing dehydrogenase component